MKEGVSTLDNIYLKFPIMRFVSVVKTESPQNPTGLLHIVPKEVQHT